MAPRVRQGLACVLLAGGAVWFWWMGFKGESPDPDVMLSFDSSPHQVVPLLILGLLPFLTGLVLAFSAWWARLVSFAWALTLAITGVLQLRYAPAAGGALLLCAAVLSLSLAGRRMFEHFEGAAPAGMSWSSPGMNLLRAAVITNVGGVMAVAWLMTWRPLRQTGCVGWRLLTWHEVLPALITVAALAALTTVGVILLARQKTAGLLVLFLGVSSMGAWVLSRGTVRLTDPWQLYLVPGAVCGWAAFLRYLPRMVRFLRA